MYAWVCACAYVCVHACVCVSMCEYVCAYACVYVLFFTLLSPWNKNTSMAYTISDSFHREKGGFSTKR